MSSDLNLKYLKDLWDDPLTQGMDEPELLRYRSNLLGADLRITNFGGGNTSAKVSQTDPLTGEATTALWVKGSGGDLGSIRRQGFATLYLSKLHGLEQRYRGVQFEDEMVEMYPLCTFGLNPVAASIDTPLHGYLPFRHVDHLHPDWGIALAASANGRELMEEFNQRFGHRMVWIPWQRPGFDLGLKLRQAVGSTPGCDGIVLGGHGLFTWGETSRESYVNTLRIIDQLGQFVVEKIEAKGADLFGGARFQNRGDRAELATHLLPFLRGRVSGAKKLIGHWNDLPEVLRFANSKDAAALARLGTSCPDHFIRTKIRPLFVDWNPSGSVAELRQQIEDGLTAYRQEYEQYYRSLAAPESPAMRDPLPTVVLVPGVGMFSFGKSKPEARITGEFYINAIHVMEGATALDNGAPVRDLPQAGHVPADRFEVFHNYVALPPSEAFGIEYWRLEEAKIRRQPPEKELSRHVAFIVGGGSGIGRECALLAAGRGAHVVVGDRDASALASIEAELVKLVGREAVQSVALDIRERTSIRHALRQVVGRFGGLDILINTAAIFPSSPDGVITDEQWRLTLDINVTANYLLADEAHRFLKDQQLPAALVLTSSANAVVPKRGSEAYDVSKAALSHLVRELSISLAPHVRVNGISPATVVKGSTMFPRDRVIASLGKYGIAWNEGDSDDELRSKLANFYAQRTLTHRPIEPRHCAEAILFLASSRSERTTGHLIPVDGGLSEAFLR